ncbi:hypothetical protein ACFOLC_07740 [Lysobacter cavernae]|uniref:DUF4124 domain-containing protein n=1 Tax=Lysobacter cavernae TaxID=1685901 RepID=A0ABV7RMN9_9GAMM
MNTRPHFLAALVWLIVALASAPAPAAGGLQRCQARDGSRIYTDRACASYGAQPLPLPADLLNRLAREQAGMYSTAGVTTPTLANAGIGRRSPASGCARNARQLSLDLQAAFALGDVNRIAESYHWAGLPHRQGQQILQRLQQLTRRPLLDAQYFAATIASSGLSFAPTATATSDDAGIVQLRFQDQVVDLTVARYAGCYFVRF